MACAALIRAASALCLLERAGGISISNDHVHRHETSRDRQGRTRVLRLQKEALRTGSDRTGSYIAEDLNRSARMEMKSVLPTISHFVPGRSGGATRRNAALHETLTAMHEWPRVDLTVYVLTNKIVPEVKHMVKRQVLISSDEPVCSESWKHRFCVPWEAIRVLRSASTGGAPTTKLGYELLAEPVYDAYVYTESDIIIPETAFHFWRYHVDTLYKRGYLLLPMRAEDKILTPDVIAVDCFTEDCVNKTEVLEDKDEKNLALYKTSRDRHYLRPFNPYSGCFMMSKLQFMDYLEIAPCGTTIRSGSTSTAPGGSARPPPAGCCGRPATARRDGPDAPEDAGVAPDPDERRRQGGPQGQN
ncbi:unnamed protein product [Prorocentrum cordatum]|uniref:Uncharacterized protein n=1 Tax=Prorocentrum cordatum TaxID=2364126 RepID=A0ABN9RQN0_9DINO|nr:unnamed protein product [Polarella glacialis]